MPKSKIRDDDFSLIAVAKRAFLVRNPGPSAPAAWEHDPELQRRNLLALAYVLDVMARQLRSGARSVRHSAKLLLTEAAAAKAGRKLMRRVAAEEVRRLTSAEAVRRRRSR